MEAPNLRSRIGGSWTDQLLSSRRGAVIIAAFAALLAGILLYAFVQHYRKAPVAAAPPGSIVFIANSYIPAGTSAATIISQNLLKRAQVPANEAVVGAIVDPSALTGEVTTTGIAAGQQIAATAFTKGVASVGSYLSGSFRAIAIPFDTSHGLTSYLAPGNTVDIMDDNGSTTQVIAQDVPVLANAGGDIVLKVSDSQALVMAGASDGSKLWLTLRPSSGAKQTIQIGSEAKNL
jgi:Flp pilus assembly protein CpaB